MEIWTVINMSKLGHILQISNKTKLKICFVEEFQYHHLFAQMLCNLSQEASWIYLWWLLKTVKKKDKGNFEWPCRMCEERGCHGKSQTYL